VAQVVKAFQVKATQVVVLELLPAIKVAVAAQVLLV
jgi:hypothetical protein